MLIESLCGTMEAVVCLGHGGVPRSEIPEQSKRAGSLRTGLTTTVKIQTRFKIAVHTSHQAVKHIAGPMAGGMIEVRGPLFSHACRKQDSTMTSGNRFVHA